MSFDRAALLERRIDYYEFLRSTMTAATTIRISGVIVIANQQSAGQGRHGRSWYTERTV